MIETDIDYPAGLPNPLREGHGLRPISPFMNTRMQSGRSRSRRSFTNVPTLGTWDFLFKTDNHAAAFEAWFRDAIDDGAAWFNIERKTPLGLIKLVCKFTDVYTGPTLVGRSSWRFSCPLEVWERPLMPEGWGNFPWFVTEASILDLAMNREWPGLEDVVLLTEDGELIVGEVQSIGGMVPVRISQLPNAGPLAGPEYVPVVQDGVTKKTTVDDVSVADDTDYLDYYESAKDE